MNWTQVKLLSGLSGIYIIETLCAFLGGYDLWLKALVTFVVLDYLSGVLRAFVEGCVNSDIGCRGIYKKMFIFILVVVAQQIDILLGLTIIRTAVIGFYLGTEGLSILENAGRAGVPLPAVLKESLEKIKNSAVS